MKKYDITDLRKALAEGMPELGNTVALGLFDISTIQTVERDEAGIPIAWQIFKLGKNEVTKHSGERFTLDFTAEMFDTIIANFAEKGSVIPLDSRHFLHYLAVELKVDEMDVLKMLPGGRGTFGFGRKLGDKPIVNSVNTGFASLNQSPFYVAFSPKHEIFSFLRIQFIKKHESFLKLHMLKYIADYWRVPKFFIGSVSTKTF